MDRAIKAISCKELTIILLLICFQPDYKKIAKLCNIWRNYRDIDDSWHSVAKIIEFYGKDHSNFIEVAGPGGFNDPDMVNCA